MTKSQNKRAVQCSEKKNESERQLDYKKKGQDDDSYRCVLNACNVNLYSQNIQELTMANKTIKQVGFVKYFKSKLFSGNEKAVLRFNDSSVRQATAKHKDKLYRYGKDVIYLLHDDKVNDIADHVGYITLVRNTGEIGLIFLDQQYRGFTLGKQFLDRSVVELERNGNYTVLAVASKEHPFRNNLSGAV
jgi:hypothetical protein